MIMLVVAEDEIDEVVSATRRLTGALPVLPAEGDEYRHNPFGAPELFFRSVPAFVRPPHGRRDT
jgi:hypothetical protein